MGTSLRWTDAVPEGTASCLVPVHPVPEAHTASPFRPPAGAEDVVMAFSRSETEDRRQ